MSGPGPTLPTWALQQVGGYLRYTGRAANIVAEAARDPKRSFVCGRVASSEPQPPRWRLQPHRGAEQPRTLAFVGPGICMELSLLDARPIDFSEI